MEIEAQKDTNSQNGFTNRHDPLDSEAAKEIHYLDEVLEGNSFDPAAKMNSNGISSPELRAVNINGSRPSDSLTETPPAYISKDILEGGPITSSTDYKEDCCEPSLTTNKKSPRFELRAFQEEKKPSKLFDSSSEREIVRVTKVRDAEEMEELERERQELIRSQAMKKNPGIAAKWWNPPPIKTLEEELDPEQLESHRKYEERKQRKPEAAHAQQTLPEQTPVSAKPVETVEKEDVLEEKASQRELRLAEPTKEAEGLQSYTTQENPTEASSKKDYGSRADSPTEQTNVGREVGTEARVKDGDFCARAVTVVLQDADLTPSNCSCHPEEIDSGLDDLSLQSQDTAAQECLSNDFSMDNGSDASIEATSTSLGDYSSPASPQATTPVEEKVDVATKVQCEPRASPSPTGMTLMEHHTMVQKATKESDDLGSNHSLRYEEGTIWQPTPPPEGKPRFDPPQVSSPVRERREVIPEVPVRTPAALEERQEFSYFSKYSEAAELRSTASLARPREPEVTSGPFKLRSHKRQTLSLIEEEIRAAQQREEELKRQRQARNPHLGPSHAPRAANMATRLVVTGKTAPGKIEKVQCVSLSASAPDVPVPPSVSDACGSGSEGGQRPKNFMQTLMDDYETHKVKRRDMQEDTRVLEATRVTRRQSDMAIRWEAGIYTNQEEGTPYEEDAPPHPLSQDE